MALDIGHKNLLLIEVGADQLYWESLSLDCICEHEETSFPLQLPKAREHLKGRRGSGPELQRVLAGLDGRNTTIVIGFRTDPFLPFQGKFDQTIGLLRAPQLSSFHRVVLQTRSPLCVLALPMLKSLGKKAGVTLSFEAGSDSAARTLTPSVPPLSERLKAARALRAFSISVTAQVAPIVHSEHELKTLAGAVLEASDYVHIVRPGDISFRGPCRGIAAFRRVVQQLARERYIESRPNLLLAAA